MTQSRNRACLNSRDEDEMATGGTAVQLQPAELSLHKEGGVDVASKPAGPRRAHPLHQLSLQSQSSTASSATKVRPVTLCIYTMRPNESVPMTFPSGRFTTVTQIMERVLPGLGMPPGNADIFSIWLSSKHLQLQLKSYHLPCKLFKRWKDLLSQFTSASYLDVCEDEPILYLQRNSFFSLREERKLLDPKKDCRKAIELLYHEAVFNVTKARYPVSKENLHTLAGLQAAVFVAESGNTDPNPTSPVNFPLERVYPQYLLGTDLLTKVKNLLTQKQKAQLKEIQANFDAAFRSAWQKTTDVHQLRVLYLQLCWSFPFYGSVMFRGQIERQFSPLHLLTYHDKQVVVAINTQGLHLLKGSPPPDILLYLTYDQLSWEFEPASEEGEDFYSSLWLEFDSVMEVKGKEKKAVSKRVRIFSRQAPMMDAMISRCVADIDQYEVELRKKRVEQGNEEVLPDVSITTHREGEAPRIQRQEKNYKEHKLPCTMYTPQGELIQSDFTLTRVLKKRKSKPLVSATQSQLDPAAEARPSSPLSKATEDQPMLSMGRERSVTEGSKESNTEL